MVEHANVNQFKTRHAEGQTMQYHLFPQAQQGGLGLYPFSGILDGCRISNISLTEADSVSGGNPPSSYVQFDLSSGNIKLDGTQIHVQQFSGSSDAVIIPLPSEFDDLSLDYTGDTNYDLVMPVFFNARRKSPAFETGNIPSAGSYSQGDIIFEVHPHYEFDHYLIVRDILRHDGSQWVTYNNEIVFESPIEGVDHGHNNLPFNAVKDSDFTPSDNDIWTAGESSSFAAGDPGYAISRLPEKKVFHGNARPPYVGGPSLAYLRESAALYVADITINVKIVAGSFDSVNSTSVSYRYSRTQIAI